MILYLQKYENIIAWNDYTAIFANASLFIRIACFTRISVLIFFVFQPSNYVMILYWVFVSWFFFRETANLLFTTHMHIQYHKVHKRYFFDNVKIMRHYKYHKFVTKRRKISLKCHLQLLLIFQAQCIFPLKLHLHHFFYFAGFESIYYILMFFVFVRSFFVIKWILWKFGWSNG